MNRRSWTIVGALVLGLAGVLLIVAYVKDAEDRALAGEKLVRVLVASEPIEAGTAGEDIDTSVRTERIPVKVRAKGAIGSLTDLSGRVAAVDIQPGEQLLVSRFVAPDEVSKGVGVVRVPKGLLEATISLEPERALGGLVRPGTRVAVLASFDSLGGGDASTGIILHKVLVTNVQLEVDAEAPSEPSRAPARSLLVTLAGSPTDVERLMFAAEHGSLWLAAEPADAPDGSSIMTPTRVFGD